MTCDVYNKDLFTHAIQGGSKYLPLPLLAQGQDGLEGSEDGGGELQCVAAVVAPPSLGLEHAVVVGVEAIVRLARPPVGVAQPLLALGPGEHACSAIYII